MSHLDLFEPSGEHPLDALERVALRNDWRFERSGNSELAVTAEGRWSGYQVSFTWMDHLEALHVACAFDLKAPDTKRGELVELVALVNEQLWLGHFDLWTSEKIVMFRHTLPLAGGAEMTAEQGAVLLETAVEACDRYYQAFQFVVWAGKPPREALDHALFETEGEA